MEQIIEGLSWYNGGVGVILVSSLSLHEAETLVKLWPTQSRCHWAPNNDLNVMTDDTECVDAAENRT